MRIDLYVNRAELSTRKLKENQIAVAIDVLRATTTMVTAFANGCREIIPVAEVEQAMQQAKEFSVKEVVLGGERNEQALPGFDLSNSPSEYSPEAVRDKTVIFTTTNGSQLFRVAKNPVETLVCSFLNVSAVADYLLKEKKDVAVLCAGKYEEFGIEDVVCGGAVVSKILRKTNSDVKMNDGAIAALRLVERYNNNFGVLLAESNHGKRLLEIGREEDLAFAGQVDIYDIVPVWRNGVIRVK